MAAAAAQGRSHNLTLVMALMICVQVLLVIMCCSSMCLVKADPDPLTDFAPGVTTFTFKDLNKNGVIQCWPWRSSRCSQHYDFPSLNVAVIRSCSAVYRNNSCSSSVRLLANFEFHLMSYHLLLILSQGITVVRFELVPCGTNPPHTHPRASELLFLISGGPLLAGFVDTSGVAHLSIIYAGDVTIFPRALLHFETNLGTETAIFLSGLNSQNPGTL
ncbi:unnamed protein product, partial [Sphagnum compactum]